MTSPQIPSHDKALLEAQAKAGPAGVDAYEAARTELQNQQRTTLSQAAQAAQSRGAPAGAMESVLPGAGDIYQSRLDSMTQAQASAQSSYDRRTARESAYSDAVQGARSLIQDQAEAAAMPIRLQGQIQADQISRQGQSAVDSINSQIELDTARFNMDLQAAQQAAKLEEERWLREMEQRERLAALDRQQRAAAAARSGGPATVSLSEGEIATMLQQGGINNLANTLSQISASLEPGAPVPEKVGEVLQLAKASRMTDLDGRTKVFEDLFPKPDQDKDPQGFMDWLGRRARWQKIGPQEQDFVDLVSRDADPVVEGLSRVGSWAVPQQPSARELLQRTGQWAVQGVPEPMNPVDAAFADAMGNLRTAWSAGAERRGQVQEQLGQIGLPADTDPWIMPNTQQRFDANLTALDFLREDLSPYIGLSQTAGMAIRNPMDIAQALGGAPLPEFEVNPALGVAQNAANAARFGQEELPEDARAAQAALRLAMEAGVSPEMMARYGLDPAEVLHALNSAAGSSAYQLAQGDETPFADLLSQRRNDMQTQITDLASAARTAAADDRQQVMDEWTWDQRADAADKELEELATAEREAIEAETWRNFTGTIDLSGTGFETYTDANQWLQMETPGYPGLEDFAGQPIAQTIQTILQYFAQETDPTDQEEYLGLLGITNTAANSVQKRLYEILFPKINPRRNSQQTNTPLPVPGSPG
jgi:hypothetical protein